MLTCKFKTKHLEVQVLLPLDGLHYLFSLGFLTPVLALWALLKDNLHPIVDLNLLIEVVVNLLLQLFSDLKLLLVGLHIELLLHQLLHLPLPQKYRLVDDMVRRVDQGVHIPLPLDFVLDTVHEGSMPHLVDVVVLSNLKVLVLKTLALFRECINLLFVVLDNQVKIGLVEVEVPDPVLVLNFVDLTYM